MRNLEFTKSILIEFSEDGQPVVYLNGDSDQEVQFLRGWLTAKIKGMEIDFEDFPLQLG